MSPQGFGYDVRRDATVAITHHGAHATTLRGGRAAEFLAEVDGVSDEDAQLVMARWTGNFKRGNERQAREHPRNRGR
ncbi:MAG: hypothetical protein ACR2JD_02695 [Nocardioides sp.]